jgi:hypothetical protein
MFSLTADTQVLRSWYQLDGEPINLSGGSGRRTARDLKSGRDKGVDQGMISLKA